MTSYFALRNAVAFLRDTKNGTSREVPLPEKALASLGDMESPPPQRRDEPIRSAVSGEGSQRIFNLTAGTISTRFRELCKETGIKGLSFHCLRRTAATRLSKKLDVWQLCAMFGWRDPKIPMKHYYKSDAAEIAARLDSK